MAFVQAPRVFRSPDSNVSGGGFSSVAPFDEKIKANISRFLSSIRDLKAGDQNGLKKQVEQLEAEFKSIASTNQNLICGGPNQNFKISIWKAGIMLKLQITGPAGQNTIRDLESDHFGHLLLAQSTINVVFWLNDETGKGKPTADLSVEALSGNPLIGEYHAMRLFSSKGEPERGINSLMKIAAAISNYAPEKKTINAEDKKELEVAALKLVDVIIRRDGRAFDAAAKEVISVFTKIAAQNPLAVREDGTLSWSYYKDLNDRGLENILRSDWHPNISLWVPNRRSFVTLYFSCSDGAKGEIRISSSPAYKPDLQDHAKIFVDVAEYLLNFDPKNEPRY